MDSWSSYDPQANAAHIPKHTCFRKSTAPSIPWGKNVVWPAAAMTLHANRCNHPLLHHCECTLGRWMIYSMADWTEQAALLLRNVAACKQGCKECHGRWRSIATWCWNVRSYSCQPHPQYWGASRMIRQQYASMSLVLGSSVRTAILCHKTVHLWCQGWHLPEPGIEACSMAMQVLQLVMQSNIICQEVTHLDKLPTVYPLHQPVWDGVSCWWQNEARQWAQGESLRKTHRGEVMH